MTNCRLCGARVSDRAESCPVCLAPSAIMSSRRGRRSLKHLLMLGLLAVLFLGTCSALVPLSFRLTDPMTDVPLGTVPSLDLPVVVVTGTRAEVILTKYPFRVPSIAKGSSFLVPKGKEKAIEQYLRDHENPHAEGGWWLRVKQLGSDRQRIELFWVNDGFRGGAYEATAATVTPLYQKFTGPGFGIAVAVVAFCGNALLWALALGLLWLYRRKRRPLNPSSTG